MCAWENAFQTQPLPLHFAKIPVWCYHGMVAFIVDIFFFENKVVGVFSPAQSMGYIIHLFRASTLFQHYNNADVWGKAHFKTKIALFRYIATPMKRLLDRHIRNDSFILLKLLFNTFTVSRSETLQSVCAVLRFQFVGENGGQHFEQSLIKS